MLQIHFSNRFELLADLLLERLAREQVGPLQAQQVIVPSAAVRRKLALTLAERRGVCAQVHFDYLARWLWEHLRQWVTGAAGPWPFEPGVLKWVVYDALGEARWTGAHRRLQAYLAAGDEVMRFELAQRVAAVFDQYLTYRPEWLDAWARGEPGLEPAAADAREDRDWQAALWRELGTRLNAGAAHPALRFVEALAHAEPGAWTRLLPASLHVFALPAMPPLHLHLLTLLGRQLDVNVYAINPCEEYWFEVVEPRRLAYLAARGRAQHQEVGHPLLAGWGRQTQSQLALLIDAAGDAVVDDARFEPHTGSSLLARWQNAILRLEDWPAGSVDLAEDDRSLEVHVCHSRTRELEVLHDRLLSLFAADPTLTPADVLVATPDLDAAAPLIDAVFGTAPRERHIPYTITGRGNARINPVARALLDALDLADSRFPVSAVHALLQQAPVARRFGLESASLTTLHEWLRQAAVHWGLDGPHRAEFDVPAVQRHTLADGLERLFLGHALPDELEEPFLGKLPAGSVEGLEAQTLGALWGYAQTLRTLRHDLCAPHPAHEWPRVLAGALESLVAASDEELEDLRDVHQAIDTLATQWTASLKDTPLPLAVVRTALADVLEDAARGGVPTGMVTFTSMHSLRQLPYRVVCVVGLDDGAYPSTARAPEFDLIAQAPRRGDRQRALDERNVFLDLLLAARDVVHLSHVGRSVRDNSPLPPSVLVAELLDHLALAIAKDPTDPASVRAARARLVVEHPLQPFARQAFRVDADTRLRSHRAEYAQALRALNGAGNVPAHEEDRAGVSPPDRSDEDAADGVHVAPFFTSPLAPPEPEWREVALADLVRFYRHPCRYLLERRMGLALPEAPDELQDDEPFVAERPMQWALADLVLPRLLAGADPDEVRALARAGTAWPLGAPGEQFLARELAQLQAFADRLRPWYEQALLPPQPIDLEVVLEDGERWRVYGAQSQLRPSGLVRWRYGDLQPRDRLGAWIEHLALCAQQPPGVALESRVLARDATARFRACPDAVAVLRDLVSLYRQGLREPLHFFPRTAWTLVEHPEKPQQAVQVWAPSNGAGESQDPVYRLAWRGRQDPLEGDGLQALRETAQRIYGPLRACLVEEGGAG